MEYLKFTEIDDTGKTKVYQVTSVSGSKLGQVRWYGPWRKYTFMPEAQTIFDVKCLGEVRNFINGLMRERNARNH